VAAAAFLVLIGLPALLRLYVDRLWFDEVGYLTVFSTAIRTKVLLFVLVSVVTFGFIYLNLRFAQRHVSLHPVRLRTSASEEPLELAGMLQRLSLALALVFAGLSGMAATGRWLDVLKFFNTQPFNTADAVLNLDVAYYVFRLPVYEWALTLGTSVTIITGLALIAIYWARGDLVLLMPRRVMLDPAAGIHVGCVAAVVLILMALRLQYVSIPGLLFSASEQIQGGAGYTDIHARIPAFRIAAITALLGAAFVIYGAFRRRAVWHLALAAGAYALVTVVGTALVPAFVQNLVVAPTELKYEAPQLERHIAGTRRAWGLESVTVRDMEGDVELTLDDLRNNAPTLENVRLWDRDPLMQTFGQLQEIRTYYDFVNVDDDRYWIDGRYRQVLLSARELNPASLPTRNFINTHLTFTHGMGLTLSPVNQVTSEGLPVLFVKDLPPVTSVSINVTRPQIYFGELTSNYVVVNTRQAEFDYPAGDSAATTHYDGTAGIRLGGVVKRAVLAMQFGSAKLLLSRDASADSRVLFRREIVQRAQTVFPFLQLDNDPYLVIDEEGRLKWILDGYTSTSRYPYSLRAQDGMSYMRNSAKITIDAYDGTVYGYIVDAGDPIIKSLSGAFPGVLLPLDSMPADLRTHLRYPEDLFRLQTLIYARYHMTETRTFYNREDQWQIPTLDEGQGPARSPFLRHIVMRLPEEEAAEFILMTPYTPQGKDNLAAWIVARNDGARYGELVVYRFPRQSLVFGPRQVVNRINQDPEIAQQISLWDQRGSQVIRGQLLVIPVEASLIYVQPLYLRAEGGRIPELKRVVVAYQNTVVMEETLDRGLAMIFGGSTGVATRPAGAATTAPGATSTPSLDVRTTELLREVRQQYDRAIAAQRGGDWATYGEAMQEVGQLIRELASRIPPG
jgi:hypothetical protein